MSGKIFTIDAAFISLKIAAINRSHDMNIASSSTTFISSPARSYGNLNTLAWLSVMAVLWGLGWPATKVALGVVPPLWLATFRFGSAAICLFIFLAMRGKLRLPSRADLPMVASMGFLQMMAFTGLSLMAMMHVDTSRSVLLAYTTPLWGLVMSWLFFRNAPTRLQLMALIVGLAGIGLVCSPLEMDWNAPGSVMGALFLIGAAIAWSVVILHIKRHRWVSSPLALAPWQMTLATIPLACFAYALEKSPATIPVDIQLIELLFFIGPVATSACFVISAEYGRRISVFAMSNFTLAVPVIGIVASVIFLGNQLTPFFMIGLGLIMAGMILAAIATTRRAS
jgi:drug/metabolite transporter (DMT)-like permease